MVAGKVLFALAVVSFIYAPGRAQINVKDSLVSAPFLSAAISYHMPAGDLKNRFGGNAGSGISFFYKTKKNWLIGANGYFLFGGNVKETHILDSISVIPGYVIDINGELAPVNLYERGLMSSVFLGKIFPSFGPNKNSGIIVTAGAGLLQHKIYIEVKGGEVPGLEKEYKKGYDRLTNGLMLSAFAGYFYLDNRRRINFFGGIEYSAAFTKNRRTINYDTLQKDNTLRHDFLWGIRAGWVIPLYKKLPDTYYYN